MKADSK